MVFIGADISKNHGALAIYSEKKSDMILNFFTSRPAHKKELKEESSWFSKEEHELYTFDDYKISITLNRQIINYKTYDKLVAEQKRAEAISEALIEQLSFALEIFKSEKVFIVFEDYAYGAQGSLTRLAQVMERIKSYMLLQAPVQYNTSLTLFMCAVQTWRSLVCGSNNKKGITYDEIEIAWKHTVKEIIGVSPINSLKYCRGLKKEQFFSTQDDRSHLEKDCLDALYLMTTAAIVNNNEKLLNKYSKSIGRI